MTEDGSGRDFALEVVRRLQQAGYQALWAGGCVRDLILGQTPADYDVATDATPEQVMAALPFRAVTVGISFGVVRVRHPHRSGSRGRGRDFPERRCLCRRPAARIGRIQLARARRRPPRFHDQRNVSRSAHGQADRLRWGPGGPEESRLRAPSASPRPDFVRTSCGCCARSAWRRRFQFQIEPATLAAIKSMAGQVVTVSKERIAQELRKMLVHESRAKRWSWLSTRAWSPPSSPICCR